MLRNRPSHFLDRPVRCPQKPVYSAPVHPICHFVFVIWYAKSFLLSPLPISILCCRIAFSDSFKTRRFAPGSMGPSFIVTPFSHRVQQFLASPISTASGTLAFFMKHRTFSPGHSHPGPSCRPARPRVSRGACAIQQVPFLFFSALSFLTFALTFSYPIAPPYGRGRSPTASSTTIG